MQAQRSGRRILVALGLTGVLALTACGTATAGHASHKASTAGPHVLANGQDQLPLPFNAIVFGDAGGTTADGTGFDGNPQSKPNTLNAQGLPTGNVKVTLGTTSVTFFIPPLGDTHKSAIQFAVGSKSITVPAHPGKYSSIYLLDGAGYGPGDLTVTPIYGGTTGKPRTVQVDDWCSLAVGDTLGTGAQLVLASHTRITFTGGSQNILCGMEGIGVPLNPAQTLTAVKFGNAATTPIGLQKDSSQQTNLMINVTSATLVPAG